MIGLGRQRREAIVDALDDALDDDAWSQAFSDALRAQLAKEGRSGRKPKNLNGSTAAKKQFGDAAGLLPPEWVAAQETRGTVHLRLIGPRERAYAIPMLQQKTLAPKKHFKHRPLEAGDGLVTSRKDDEGTSLHEFVHRLQATMPELDARFQDLHRRRTSGDPTVAINRVRERGKPDHYLREYQGREYPEAHVAQLNGGDQTRTALEVMTMAIQMVLSDVHGARLQRDLLRSDPEMIDLTLGALFNFDP